MESLKEAMMVWGEAMTLRLEKRCLFYSVVMGKWCVTDGFGHEEKRLYEGENFGLALDYLLGTAP